MSDFKEYKLAAVIGRKDEIILLYIFLLVSRSS
jgi:hypothetical protein